MLKWKKYTDGNDDVADMAFELLYRWKIELYKLGNIL